MKSPITQSQAWNNLQDELGEESVFASEENYQYLAIIKKIPAGKYLYCPYGPVADTPEGFQQALKSLIETAKIHNAIFIRVEPYEESQASILPPHSRRSIDLNPKETWLLDLKGTDEELKAKLPSRLLRYYKSASKKGITITTSHDPNDIHYLTNLQKSLASEKGIGTFSEDYLKTELKQSFATLYLVKHQDETKEEIIAAGLVFDDETTRYNLQGAQSDEGRRLHATGILTIQLILDAKTKNLETFDFWGIAPEGAPTDHPWAGFTNFKKTFAGYQYNHAGTYDIILKPAKYKLYQTLRKINRKRKK